MYDNMNNVTIICDDCEHKSTIPIDMTSDLFEIKCPVCGSDKIWYLDVNIESNNNKITLGNGGCGAPKP